MTGGRCDGCSSQRKKRASKAKFRPATSRERATRPRPWTASTPAVGDPVGPVARGRARGSARRAGRTPGCVGRRRVRTRRPRPGVARQEGSSAVSSRFSRHRVVGRHEPPVVVTAPHGPARAVAADVRSSRRSSPRRNRRGQRSGKTVRPSPTVLTQGDVLRPFRAPAPSNIAQRWPVRGSPHRRRSQRHPSETDDAR